jgi:hypothetical protein
VTTGATRSVPTGAQAVVAARTDAQPVIAARTGAQPAVAARTGAQPAVVASTGAQSAVDASADAASATESEVAAAVDASVDAASSPEAPVREPDRLLLDVAERLWRHGLTVEIDHGIPGGERIPLVVGHPEVPGELLVAVLTDDEAYVDEPSVRVRDRLVAARLERLGWSVVRVWSAAAFLDPQAEVDRIRRAVHARVPAPAVPRTGPVALGVPEVLEDEELDELPSPDAARSASPAVDAKPSTSTDASESGASASDEARAEASDAGLPATASAAVAFASEAPPADAPATEVPATGTLAAAKDADDVSVLARDDSAAAPDPSPASPVIGATDVPSAPTSTSGTPGKGLQLVLPLQTRQRPDVRRGLPIGAYSDDQLDDLVQWLISDGAERSRDELAEALRAELGITRRSHRVDTAVRSAISRGLR